mmetsp:Transcript_5193/g.11372  ORF Transcript_5193/g.11372 Transcript_5193/m.11372 type:complete len:92 (-) Transcript_5193:609-884(-)
MQNTLWSAMFVSEDISVFYVGLPHLFGGEYIICFATLLNSLRPRWKLLFLHPVLNKVVLNLILNISDHNLFVLVSYHRLLIFCDRRFPTLS